MDDLSQFIDHRLDEERPDRYDSSDKTWMATVDADVAPLVPVADARLIAARQLVQARETRATKAVNRLLREVGRTGQPPLGWFDLARRPIAWDAHRVRLDECLSGDFRDWAAYERRAAANEFTARNDACEGAERIADELDAAGARVVSEIWT